MKFTKKDLFYNNYSWATDGGDDPHYKGYLDKRKKLIKQKDMKFYIFVMTSLKIAIKH